MTNAADLLDVGAAQLGMGSVVGTDRFPRVAEALDVAGEDPGADVDARARIEEIALADAVGRQRGQPRRVDLHEPDVAGAVAVASDGLRVECGFGAGDGVEQLAADAVAHRRCLPARVGGQGGEQGDRGDDTRRRHPARSRAQSESPSVGC